MPDRSEEALKRIRTVMGMLSILPIVYCIFFILLYRVDTPFWDQWGHLSMIQKSFDGTLRFTDLWMTLNEHRVFFPNLIFVGLARLTHWNHNYELVLLFGFAIASFVLLSRLVFRSERTLDRKGTLWALPVLALFVFSFSQHNMWVWGFHLLDTFAGLCMVTAIFVLSQKTITLKQVVCATVLAVLASYSIGNGMTIWPVGLVLLLLHVVQQPARDLRYVLGWVLAAVLVVFGYFAGYTATFMNEDALDILGSPVGYALYCFAYLGGPLASFSGPLALVFGLAGSFLLIFLLYRIVVREGIDLRVVSPYIGLAMVACGSAVLTGLKHHPEGMNQALSSRFLIWSTLFWVGTLGLLYVLSLVSTNKRVRVSCYAISAFLCAFALASSLYGTYRGDERHDMFVMGRAALLSGENRENLKYLYPDVEVVESLRETLQEYKLSIYRE